MEGLHEGGLANDLVTRFTNKGLIDGARLTPRRIVMCTLCCWFLVSGVVGGDSCSKPYHEMSSEFSVHDFEFYDQVVLPLSVGHFSGGLLCFVPEELRSQTCSTGSCRLWDLVPRVGHGCWLFALWQEFQFGDQWDIQSSSTTVVDILTGH